MDNQEKLKIFLEEVLQERLIFCSSRSKKDLSQSGAMYFIQETKTIQDKVYYLTTKSKFYPDGLINQKKLLKMMKQHSKENPLIPNVLKMSPIGKYLGSTHCRCCKESLGNGSGVVIFDYKDEKFHISLTGGADHYMKHGINMNLISYSWISKEKKIKLHTQFVGDVKDIYLINNFVKTLKIETNLDNNEITKNRKNKM